MVVRRLALRGTDGELSSRIGDCRSAAGHARRRAPLPRADHRALSRSRDRGCGCLADRREPPEIRQLAAADSASAVARIRNWMMAKYRLASWFDPAFRGKNSLLQETPTGSQPVRPGWSGCLP